MRDSIYLGIAECLHLSPAATTWVPSLADKFAEAAGLSLSEMAWRIQNDAPVREYFLEVLVGCFAEAGDCGFSDR